MVEKLELGHDFLQVVRSFSLKVSLHHRSTFKFNSSHT
jgi:hypothetical protein